MKTPSLEFLLFLWFAANNPTLRDVAQRFNVSISTAHKIIEKVIDFLVDIAPTYISFPKTAHEKESTAIEFEQVSGFPDIIGCIDGTSIPIVTPAKKIKSTHTNRHDIPAVILQGICDAHKKFTDVFTGLPGKIHDSRALKLSDIYSKLPTICGNNYHILGDGAYHIREWLITPYRNYELLTEQEKQFNKKFSATRVLIENSFGLLKSRFRQLLQLHMHSVDKLRNT